MFFRGIRIDTASSAMPAAMIQNTTIDTQRYLLSAITDTTDLYQGKYNSQP